MSAPPEASRSEPEQLCTLLSGSATPDDAGLRLPRDDRSWESIVDLALRHHVLPLLLERLRMIESRQPGTVPLAVLDGLKHRQMRISAYNLRATEILRGLQADMAARGLRWIPVKGPALAVVGYGSISLRQFEDLDILVPPEDFLPVTDRLQDQGYECLELPPTVDRRAYLAGGRGWVMHRPGDPLHLDLKPALADASLSSPAAVAYMASACREMDLGDGRKLEAPKPEAMLLGVCLDGAGDLWAKLSSLADVAALLTRHPDADWSGLLADAGRLDCRRFLLTGVRLAERMLDCPVPACFRTALNRDAAARRLADQARNRIRVSAGTRAGALHCFWFALRGCEGVRNRLRYIRKTLLVPGPVEWHRHPGGEGMAWRGWIRPMRLLMDQLRRRPPRRVKAGAGPHG